MLEDKKILSIDELRKMKENKGSTPSQIFDKQLKLAHDIDNKYFKYLSDVKDVKDKNKRQELFKKFLDDFCVFYDDIYKIYSDAFLTGSILKEEIDYAMIGNGKRLRPLLTYLFFHSFNGEESFVVHDFMIAVELIHGFSLIHDDMPCMDNDELRRGKPSTWKKFGEDKALLAGDAMIFMANKVIVNTIVSIDDEGVELAAWLLFQMIWNASDTGMIGGQALEIDLQKKDKVNIDDIVRLYVMKTGDLFVISSYAGFELSGECEVDLDEDIEVFAKTLGIAYQIKDDLKDIEGDEKEIGKPLHSDEKNNKKTYVAIRGIDGAKEDLNIYKKKLNDFIDKLEVNKVVVDGFRDLIDYMI